MIDDGRLVQLDTPAQLLRRPASAMIAAPTGANVLHGTAAPAPSGSIVRLAPGGELTSSTPAEGPVQITVHPWERELADPESSPLTDDVVSVRHDRGGYLIRLTRFTIQTQPHDNGRPAITEGSTVGLRARPTDVRVLPRDQTPPTTATADES